MPYKSINELPDRVRNNLPAQAQEIYKEAFNSAWDHYDKSNQREGHSSREKTSHKVAWSAVKQKYTKSNETNVWKKK